MGNRAREMTNQTSIFAKSPLRNGMILASLVTGIASIILTLHIVIVHGNVVSGRIGASLLLLSSFQFVGLLKRPFQCFNRIKKAVTEVSADGELKNNANCYLLAALEGLVELQAIALLFNLFLLICLEVTVAQFNCPK